MHSRVELLEDFASLDELGELSWHGAQDSFDRFTHVLGCRLDQIDHFPVVCGSSFTFCGHEAQGGDFFVYLVSQIVSQHRADGLLGAQGFQYRSSRLSAVSTRSSCKSLDLPVIRDLLLRQLTLQTADLALEELELVGLFATSCA